MSRETSASKESILLDSESNDISAWPSSYTHSSWFSPVSLFGSSGSASASISTSLSITASWGLISCGLLLFLPPLGLVLFLLLVSTKPSCMAPSTPVACVSCQTFRAERRSKAFRRVAGPFGVERATCAGTGTGVIGNDCEFW